MLDSNLFLPESWSHHRPCCQRAAIPDEMLHRPKTDIALELYERAQSNGTSFAWLTFDEGLGKSPAVLAALRTRGQDFVAEVPLTCTGWIEKPRLTTRRRNRNGRPAKQPRLVQGSPRFRAVREMLEQEPTLRGPPWRAWRVKGGAKGPRVWEVKQVWFYPRGADGLPQEGAHRIVARSLLEPAKIKFLVAHALREATPGVLLQVAFLRWQVEGCFEDENTELGFEHFEGRSYVGFIRHQTITALTHRFLACTHEAWRGKIGS